MKIIIIGAGPAGASAAIYSVRGGAETVLITHGSSALAKTDKIENYYGFIEPVSGEYLYNSGIAQAKRLGAEIVEGEAVGITYDEAYTVELAGGNKILGDALIICAGVSRSAPKIDGLDRFDGAGISRCAVCDAFFYRGKRVGVLGSGEYALHETEELINIVGSVTLLTNGEEPAADFPAAVKIDKRKIAAFYGDDTLSGVEYEDGEKFELDGAFLAIGIAGADSLAVKVGCYSQNGRINVDADMFTGIPMLYAAGDCATVDGRREPLQIARAVYMGSTAAMSALKALRKQ